MFDTTTLMLIFGIILGSTGSALLLLDKPMIVLIFGVSLAAAGSKGILDCFYTPHLEANIFTAFVGLLIILYALLKE